eukprot:370222-Hanusia_phi.AAC.6
MGSLNGSRAIHPSPGKPQMQYSKREEGNLVEVSQDADTTEEDLSESWSVLSSTGGAQRSQDWEQHNPEQQQVNKLRQAIEMLQRRVRDQEAKANKFQTESQMERSRAVAQRAEMQQQVMQQVDELSRQHKVVSDLTQALEQMHLELKAAKEREVALNARMQEREEEERQIHRASKQSWTSECCEFENTHLRAEVEDLRLCLQAAKDNTSLVREGMAAKLLRVKTCLVSLQCSLYPVEPSESCSSPCPAVLSAFFLAVPTIRDMLFPGKGGEQVERQGDRMLSTAGAAGYLLLPRPAGDQRVAARKVYHGLPSETRTGAAGLSLLSSRHCKGPERAREA